MYASLFYTANNETETVYEDIIAVLTGTTNLNNLNGNLNTANSFIKTTFTTSPWALIDTKTDTSVANTTVTENVLESTISDDSGNNKYMSVVLKQYNQSSSSYDQVSFRYYTKYDKNDAQSQVRFTKPNASTELEHIAFRKTWAPNKGELPTWGTDGRIYLSASPSHAMMAGDVINAIVKPIGITEHTRISPAFKAGQSRYLPVAVFNQGTSTTASNGVEDNFFFVAKTDWFSRHSIPDGGFNAVTLPSPKGQVMTSLGSPTKCSLTLNGASSTQESSLHMQKSVTDPHTEEVGGMLIPFGVASYAENPQSQPWWDLGGDISSKTSVYMFTSGMGSAGDVVVYGGRNYRIWATGTGTYSGRFAVLEG